MSVDFGGWHWPHTRQEASLFTMSAGGSTDTKARCSLERQSRPAGTPAPPGAEKANNNSLDVLLIFDGGGVPSFRFFVCLFVLKPIHLIHY